MGRKHGRDGRGGFLRLTRHLRIASPPQGGGDGHEPLMRRVCEALGVSTAAIDYSVDADGNPVIWEANPYFFLFSPGKFILPAERRHTARSDRLFDDATRFLTALAHPAGRG